MSSEEITEKFEKAEERFDRNYARLKSLLMMGAPDILLEAQMGLIKKIGEDLHFYSGPYEEIQKGLSAHNIERMLDKVTADVEIDEMNKRLEEELHKLTEDTLEEAKTLFPEVDEERLIKLVEFIINKNF